MKTRSFLLLLFCLLLLGSCKSKKKLNGGGAKDEKSVRFYESKLENDLFTPDWMSGKIKAKYYKNGSKQQGVVIDFRLKKDEAIWMSVSPNIGIKLEVGRAMITPDRIQVMDKINKHYYDKPFTEIYDYVDYPVSFADLQNMLLGNALMREGYQSVELEGEQYALLQKGIMLLLNSDYSVAQMVMEDPAGNGTIRGEFADYSVLDDGSKFSNTRSYEMKSNETHLVEMQFSKISLKGPLNLPFNISSRYERRN